MSFLETIKNAAIVGVIGLGAYSLYECYKKQGSLSLGSIAVCFAEGTAKAGGKLLEDAAKAAAKGAKKNINKQVNEWKDPKKSDDKKLAKSGAAFQGWKVANFINEKVIKSKTFNKKMNIKKGFKDLGKTFKKISLF